MAKQSASLIGLQQAAQGLPPDNFAYRNLLFPYRDTSSTDINAIGGGLAGMAGVNARESVNGPDNPAFDPNAPANANARTRFYLGLTTDPVTGMPFAKTRKDAPLVEGS